MKNIPGFRTWFYFRMGWATYFAFIMAAINTLTVTYYLAIEKYPTLVTIFPNFIIYVIIITTIGIPLLVLVGYVHYKRTVAFKSEIDVQIESNPYQRRYVVNIDIILKLTLKMHEMLLKISKNEKFTEQELEEIFNLHKELKTFTENRKFLDNNDMEYLHKKIVNS